MSVKRVSYDPAEEAGGAFGAFLAQMFYTVRTVLVTVKSVDEANGVAQVYLFEEDKTFPVPLSLYGTEEYGMVHVPTEGSAALITFIDGDINRPVFVGISEIDKWAFKRNETAITFTTDPDEVNVTVGNSKVRITPDLIEMNEGSLDGLVIVGKLTERLNRLQQQIEAIQSAIASHSHLVATSGSATQQVGNTTTTTYAKVNVDSFDNSDYENEKIKQ
ncbi:phage baseplate assembly protein V [Alistipes putredinis]|jgi:hypothetical protein|uniref:phage baseplate assembly protein V n=1 Tax=Alistipes putredinis TaxID=28117 RepID=UPI003A8BB096